MRYVCYVHCHGDVGERLLDPKVLPNVNHMASMSATLLKGAAGGIPQGQPRTPDGRGRPGGDWGRVSRWFYIRKLSQHIL